SLLDAIEALGSEQEGARQPNRSGWTGQTKGAAWLEVEELKALADFASSIQTGAKAQALLLAIEHGLEAARGARTAGEGRMHDKAVVFTESLRTQQFLLEFLEANGY